MQSTLAIFWLISLPQRVWMSIMKVSRFIMNSPSQFPIFIWRILGFTCSIGFYAAIIYVVKYPPSTIGDWFWALWFIVLLKLSARGISQYVYHYRLDNPEMWRGVFILASLSLLYWVTILTIIFLPILHVFYFLGFEGDTCGIYVSERLFTKKKVSILQSINNLTRETYKRPHQYMPTRLATQRLQ